MARGRRGGTGSLLGNLLGTLVGLVLLALLAAYALDLHGDLKAEQADVAVRGAVLDAQAAKVAALRPALEREAREHAAGETGAEQAVAQSGAACADVRGRQEADRCAKATLALAEALAQQAQRDPALAADEGHAGVQAEVAQERATWERERGRYVESSLRHNARLERFPEALVAAVAGLDPAPPLDP